MKKAAGISQIPAALDSSEPVRGRLSQPFTSAQATDASCTKDP